MAHTQKEEHLHAEMYDKVQDRVYTKKVNCLIFSWDKIVRVDRVGSDLVLDLVTTRTPDVIIFNGKRVKLVEDITKKE